MSPQFVDIDADGFSDILAGSFSGVPQLVCGGENGFAEPRPVLDGSGETVLIAEFWNGQTNQWDRSGRSGSEGHCTSVAAVDWDADGDQDLILGDYHGGRLYLQQNHGSAAKAAFSGTNQPVEADGKPIAIEQGLAAPRIADWNGDGLFDILCGGSKGGVFLFTNTGRLGQPRFAAAVSLVDPVDDPTDSFLRRVPASDGQPLGPGSSFHIEPCDYDGDGDLDLLVGARCSWLTGPVRVLTEEELAAKAILGEKIGETMEEITALSAEAGSAEGNASRTDAEKLQKLMERRAAELAELQQYETDPTASGDFVWLFRRR